MTLSDHTKHILVSVVVLSAFAIAGTSAYEILQYPGHGSSTGENYGDIIQNKNKASAADSITVLSLADKSASNSKEQITSLKEGTTLCNPFPEKINGYSLYTKKITNSPADKSHSTFFSQKEKKNILINPEERIFLEYTQTDISQKKATATKIEPEQNTAVVQVFRYGVFADLQKDFSKLFSLTDAHVESKLVKDQTYRNFPIYVFKNENTLIAVSGKKEADIRRIAEQIGGACDNKPIYKSEIPRGYIAWRTTDTDTVNRTAYVKIADADISLVLDIKKFGSDVLVSDETMEDNLGLGDLLETSKYRVFAVPTFDEKGKARAMQDIHMFVTKSKDVQLLLNALKNRQTQVLGKKLIDSTRTTYVGLHTNAAKNVFNYESIGEDSQKGTSTEYVYIVTRKNTSFVFVYDHGDFEIVESLVDNLK